MNPSLPRRSRVLCLVLCTLGLELTACGVVPPKVTYGELAVSGNGPFGYPFRPRRSLLLVSYADVEKSFRAQAAPSELDADGRWTPLLQVRGVDDWRSTTQLKVSYLPDTKLVDEIKVTTSDNIAETIAKIGEVLAAAAPIVAGLVAAAGPPQPIAFRPTTFDPAWAGETWRQDGINPGYCLRLREVSVEQGLTLAQYMGARNGAASSDFPVASCVTGALEIAQCPSGPGSVQAEDPARVRVNFASADHVTPMRLPSTGAIKMNAVCGAVVTEADKQDRSELTAYLTALIEAVKKIEAQKKK